MGNGPAVRDEFITLDGLRFHYRDWGDVAAPPLVLLHAYLSHARSWDTVDGDAVGLDKGFGTAGGLAAVIGHAAGEARGVTNDGERAHRSLRICRRKLRPGDCHEGERQGDRKHGRSDQ